MKHFLTHDCCVEGRILKSRYGGNDPDVWDAGQCPECEGAGCDHLRLQAAEKIAGEKIVTHFWAKPIPPRNFDWCAYRDNDEPDDDGNMMQGWGRTEQDAIDDMIALIEDSRS